MKYSDLDTNPAFVKDTMDADEFEQYLVAPGFVVTYDGILVESIIKDEDDEGFLVVFGCEVRGEDSCDFGMDEELILCIYKQVV